jgi:hypothetical protein
MTPKPRKTRPLILNLKPSTLNQTPNTKNKEPQTGREALGESGLSASRRARGQRSRASSRPLSRTPRSYTESGHDCLIWPRLSYVCHLDYLICNILALTVLFVPHSLHSREGATVTRVISSAIPDAKVHFPIWPRLSCLDLTVLFWP